MATPREVRQAAGYTQARTAVESGTSEPTVRLFEANPAHVRADKRVVLEHFYQRLATVKRPTTRRAEPLAICHAPKTMA